ncbi:hypothetical protein [Labilithrix luteola]|uniref:hypothetical protein n=1 Tax=Labilithrix luteola TaxID=1391654 RepID=UPI003B82F1F1
MAAIAVLVVGLASPLNVFGTLTWYYSHLWAALAVALALTASLRADDEPASKRRWLLAGAAVAFAGLMRPQEALWILVPLAAIAKHATRREDGSLRVDVRPALVSGTLLTVGFLTVYSIQLLVYRTLYGSPFVIPQGHLYLQLGHAHPFLALFSARSGFLYWTPLLWLAVIGAPLFIADDRGRWLAIGVVLAMVLNFYVASAALSWTGSATLGARVQTSLAAGLVLATAATLSRLLAWIRRLRLSSGAVLVLAVAPWLLLTWEIGPSKVPNDRPVPAPQLYSRAVEYGFDSIYGAIGNPWTLPATAIFRLRYGAPPKVFDALATDGIFGKNYRTLAPTLSDTVTFGAPPEAYWSANLERVDKQVSLRPGRRGRFLVTLYWPWVTRVRVRAKPLEGKATVGLKSRSFFRTYDLGTLHFVGDETLELAPPDGAFDSGINEVLLETDAPSSSCRGRSPTTSFAIRASIFVADASRGSQALLERL